MSNIGKKIEEVRKAKGISRKDLATKLGISYSGLASYEQGRRQVNVDTLFAIANALGCELNDFVDYNDDTPEEYEERLFELAEEECGKNADLSEFNEAMDILMESLSKLNIQGKIQASQRIKELSMLEEYTR